MQFRNVFRLENAVCKGPILHWHRRNRRCVHECLRSQKLDHFLNSKFYFRHFRGRREARTHAFRAIVKLGVMFRRTQETNVYALTRMLHRRFSVFTFLTGGLRAVRFVQNLFK